MIRSFIAFRIPPEAKDCLSRIQKSLKTSKTNLRFTRPEGIHLTLKFLGDIPEDQVDRVHAAMESASKGQSRLSVRLGSLGAFPTPRKARVAWVGLEGDLESLVALQRSLDANLEPLGFQKEKRPFQAHLTLGRAGRNDNPPNLSKVLENLKADFQEPFSLEALVLYKSDLRPGGAVYEALREIKLP